MNKKICQKRAKDVLRLKAPIWYLSSRDEQVKAVKVNSQSVAVHTAH